MIATKIRKRVREPTLLNRRRSQDLGRRRGPPSLADQPHKWIRQLTDKRLRNCRAGNAVRGGAGGAEIGRAEETIPDREEGTEGRVDVLQLHRVMHAMKSRAQDDQAELSLSPIAIGGLMQSK